MRAPHLDTTILGVLQDPSAWQFVGTLLPSEVAPAADARHAAWSATHTHRHPYREVMVALTGTGVYAHTGRAYPCRPGSVFLFDTQEPHDMGYPEFSPPMDHLWITVAPDQYFARRHRAGTPRGSVPGSTTVLLPQTGAEGCLNACWSALRRASPLPLAIVRGRLTGCLALLLARIAESQLAPSFQDRVSAQRDAVDAVRRHLRQTAGSGDNLETLARLAGYSRFHFLRLFQRHTGQSLQGYIDTCRERRVAELTRQGRSKKDMAFELGFSCPSAFSRWLRNRSAAGTQCLGPAWEDGRHPSPTTRGR
jgi:AraC-like DNA-binding protein/mannose-6-phosphate isomerase-like protein (cupin superfamily)